MLKQLRNSSIDCNIDCMLAVEFYSPGSTTLTPTPSQQVSDDDDDGKLPISHKDHTGRSTGLRTSPNLIVKSRGGSEHLQSRVQLEHNLSTRPKDRTRSGIGVVDDEGNDNLVGCDSCRQWKPWA